MLDLNQVTVMAWVQHPMCQIIIVGKFLVAFLILISQESRGFDGIL